MLTNKAALAGMIVSYNNLFLAPTNGVYLCTGAIPTDAEIDAMTSVAVSQIVTNKAVSFAGIPRASMQAKDVTIPALVYSTTAPAVANATQTGTLTWGILHGANGFAVVSVGLPNSGAVIQVNTLDAVAGSPVTLMSVSYKFGR